MDGLAVLREIWVSDDLHTLPVLTTSKTERDGALAYEQHTNSYVVKPLDFEER